MKNNPIKALPSLGQSIWYDNIQRSMLSSGGLSRLIEEDDLRGVTTNPAIFQKAVAESDDYDDSLALLWREYPGRSYEEYFTSLAIDDIREAADILRPVYERTDGQDGLVSIEVSPLLAYDTDGSIAEGKELFARIGRPNVMIKIPATKAGLPAIEELIASGIHVNATLLFSVERYVEVAEAFIRGIRRRYENGAEVRRIASVASFFVSRVDAAVDKALADRTGSASSWERTKLESRLPPLPETVFRQPLWRAAAGGRPETTPAVGQHRHQEPRLQRHTLRPVMRPSRTTARRNPPCCRVSTMRRISSAR